ncbi:MAG: hypothetical protein IJE77_14695 [Thermoguttaceae bacterium]|nr:hypothetical protein [Thermoguttaceae bacterium]MBQ9800935.1 hypothetical protein [Thermoguttaceae bacterium]
MGKTWKTLVAVSLAFCCVAFVGCAKKDGLTPVKGTVTFDGEPIKDGSINFAPKGGPGTATGARIVDGKYEARVSPGKMAVTIEAQKKVPIENPTQEQIDRGITENTVDFIPAKYNRMSTLEADIAEGQKDPIDFALTSEE